MEVIIIGGGIAGLATAFHLVRRGWSHIEIVEREAAIACHSSGRNAAIFRQLAGDSHGAGLAARSRELLDAGPGDLDSGWLSTTGALYSADAIAVLEPLRRHANRVDHRIVGVSELRELAPDLAGGGARHGLFVPGDGVIDVHAVTEALAREARRAGVTISTGRSVRQILVTAGQVSGVLLDDGRSIDAPRVVIAAGAWAAGLGAAIDAPLPLTPYRRHLAILKDDGAPRTGPVVWNQTTELYYRPEPGGLLASPCDEDAFRPCLPPTSVAALEQLARRLEHVAPAIADMPILRHWACLRTFTPDRGFVAGADPRVAGLYWLAGLGGRGMTEGLAVAEVLGAVMDDAPHPLTDALSPSRVLAELAERR